MQVTIVDFGSGNLRSAAKAFAHAAADQGLACRVVVSARAEDVAAATHVVLPGDGAFADCKRGLLSLPGVLETLSRVVRMVVLKLNGSRSLSLGAASAATSVVTVAGAGLPEAAGGAKSSG